MAFVTLLKFIISYFSGLFNGLHMYDKSDMKSISVCAVF